MTDLDAPRHPGWTLALLAFAQLIIALDVTIVYVALPELGSDLEFSVHTLQWVASAYAVAFGGALLFGGRAADLLGRRRMFVLALLLYAGSSLAGGFATTPAMIVAARAVQGLGGALLFPATLSLVNVMFAEGRERNRALAVWGGAGASGLSIGSLLGGLLTTAFGWQAVFFVNVPLAIGAAVLALLLIDPDHGRESGRSFDLPGVLTATASATLLVVALVQGPVTGWGSASILIGFALSAVLLGLFIVIEARATDPLMPLHLLANRSLRAAMAITFLFMGTFGALFYVLTIYFQEVLGFGALQAGLAFLVPSLFILAGTQIGERITTRTSVRTTLLIGLVVGAAGTALLAAQVGSEGSYVGVIPGMVLYAIGQGTSWTGMWIAASAGVSPREQGVASGMASTTMQIGAAVGLAVLVAVANSGLDGMSGNALRAGLADGLGTATYIAAGGIVLGALVALTLGERPSRAPLGFAAKEPAAAVDR